MSRSDFLDKARKVLQNKAIEGGVADNSHRIVLPQNSTSALAGLERHQGAIAYDSTLSSPVVDNGSSGFIELSTSSGAQTLSNKTLADVAGMTTVVGIGAKNGATVSAVENGGAVVHKTVLTLASTPVTVANVTGASFGGVKVYDFPEGRILVLGTTANLSFNWHGLTIDEAGSGDFSLGSTLTADATLGGTDVNLLPSTGMLDPFVAGVGTGKGALAASAHFDGTSAALDAYLNLIIDDADVADAASTIVLVSGTITLTWINLGDY